MSEGTMDEQAFYESVRKIFEEFDVTSLDVERENNGKETDILDLTLHVIDPNGRLYWPSQMPERRVAEIMGISEYNTPGDVQIELLYKNPSLVEGIRLKYRVPAPANLRSLEDCMQEVGFGTDSVSKYASETRHMKPYDLGILDFLFK